MTVFTNPNQGEDWSEPYLNPDWSETSKVHNWKEYLSGEIKEIWNEFSVKQKHLIYRNAEDMALWEEWD